MTLEPGEFSPAAFDRMTASTSGGRGNLSAAHRACCRCYVDTAQRLYYAQRQFLGIRDRKVPYIIGIAGSAAVGKSSTARVLQALLARWSPRPKVDLVTTDGFLYSAKRCWSAKG